MMQVNRKCPPVRYMAIIHPLQQRLTSTETRVVIAVIWVLALLLAFPQYYFSSTALLPGRTVCYIDWPEYSTVDFKKMWVPEGGQSRTRWHFNQHILTPNSSNTAAWSAPLDAQGNPLVLLLDGPRTAC